MGVLPGTTYGEVSHSLIEEGQQRGRIEMELEKIGRTVGRGATLGFCFRASMTPVIVAMFYYSYCNCVVAMRQGFYDNDGEVLMRVSRLEWSGKRRKQKEGKERALGLVGKEAWLDDWLAGQCGVLNLSSICLGCVNQGTLRQINSVL